MLGKGFHSIVVEPSEQLCVSRDAVNDILEAVPKLPCSRLVYEAYFGGVTSAPQPTLRSSEGAVASQCQIVHSQRRSTAILSATCRCQLVIPFDLHGMPWYLLRRRK